MVIYAQEVLTFYHPICYNIGESRNKQSQQKQAKSTMTNAPETKQDLEIPLNGSVELFEPSAFSVTINRWSCGESDECFVIVVKDGTGAIVHRSEFNKTIEGK